MMKTNPGIILYLPSSEKSATVIVKYGHFRDLCKNPLQNIYLNYSNPKLLIVIKHSHDTVTFHPLSRNLFITSKSIDSGTDDLITSDSDYDSILFQSLRLDDYIKIWRMKEVNLVYNINMQHLLWVKIENCQRK